MIWTQKILHGSVNDVRIKLKGLYYTLMTWYVYSTKCTIYGAYT